MRCIRILLMGVLVLWGIPGLSARTYYLPDYQNEFIYGSRVQDSNSGQHTSTPSCSAYGLYSALERPSDTICTRTPDPTPGLVCYSCSCSADYIYDSANCSGDYIATDSCGGKYKNCVCDPAKYPSASGCSEGQQPDTAASCTNKSDNVTVYKCVDDPCYGLMLRNACLTQGRYCLSSSACPAACESCDADTCSWPENAGYSSCDEGCDGNGAVEGCFAKCKTGCRSKSCPEGQKLSGSSCVVMSCAEAAAAYGYTPVTTEEEFIAGAGLEIPMVILNDITTDQAPRLSKNIYTPAALNSLNSTRFAGCTGMQTPTVTMDWFNSGADIAVYPGINATESTSTLTHNVSFYGDAYIDFDSTLWNNSTRTYSDVTADFYGGLKTPGSDFYGRATFNLHNTAKKYEISDLPYVINLDAGVTLTPRTAGTPADGTVINMKKDSMLNVGCTYKALENTTLTFPGDDIQALSVALDCPYNGDDFSCQGKLERQSCIACADFISQRFGSSSYAQVSTEGELKAALQAKKSAVLMKNITLGNNSVISGKIYSPAFLSKRYDPDNIICGQEYTLSGTNAQINSAQLYVPISFSGNVSTTGTSVFYKKADIYQLSGAGRLELHDGFSVEDTDDYTGYLDLYNDSGAVSYTLTSDLYASDIRVNQNTNLTLQSTCPSCTLTIVKDGCVNDSTYRVCATSNVTSKVVSDINPIPASCPVTGTSYIPTCSGSATFTCLNGGSLRHNIYGQVECPSGCAAKYWLVNNADELKAAAQNGGEGAIVYLTKHISVDTLSVQGDLFEVHSASEVCADEGFQLANLAIDKLETTRTRVRFYTPVDIIQLKNTDSGGYGYDIEVYNYGGLINEINVYGEDPNTQIRVYNARLEVDEITLATDSSYNEMTHFHVFEADNSDIILGATKLSCGSFNAGDVRIQLIAKNNSSIKTTGICSSYFYGNSADSSSSIRN